MKILIVDDSSLIRAQIKNELFDLGCEMLEATDGVVALRQLALNSDVSLIILDVEMPKMDGFETYGRILKYRKALGGGGGGEIPVIFCTTQDSLEYRQKGFELGATDFISKKNIETELLTAVTHILKSDEKLKGISVLVVDDSGLQRKLITDLLHREGVRTEDAVNGKEALDKVSSQKNKFDMFIVDLNMPVMGGEEFTHKIRVEMGLKDVPIIILSAEKYNESKINLFKLGASDYLNKPFIPEELFARIGIHLKGCLLKRKLKEKIKKLKELDKMKDDFLSICSHDLRSPLNGILGCTELLLSESETLGEETVEMLELIKISGDFLLKLIDEILTLSKVQAEKVHLELKKIKIHSIIRNCVDFNKYTSNLKGIKLNYRNNSKETQIKGDKNALMRVMNNLISNAIKFTPRNGDVSISLKVDNEKKELFVSVKDTGIGISEKQAKTIFDKFSKSSTPGTEGEKGTGLGLMITKEIVEQHNGRIEFDSNIGEGACFKIILPLSVASKSKTLS